MAMNPRAHMEAVLRNGASVMLPNLRTVTTLEELPTEAELARLEVKVAERSARVAKEMNDDDPLKKSATAGADRAMAAALGREAAANKSLRAQADRINADLAAVEARATPPAPKVGPSPAEPKAPAPAMKPAAHPVARPAEAPKGN